MSENVICLRGKNPQPATKTNARLIAELERLLDAARSGEIIGMAGSYVHQNNVVSYSYAGAIGGYALLGGLECVKEKLLRLALVRG